MKVLYTWLSVLMLGLACGAAPIRVGVIGTSDQKVLEALKTQKDIAAEIITDCAPETLKRLDVLVVSNVYPYQYKDTVRQAAAENGLGVMMTHDSAGSGRTNFQACAAGTFNELAVPHGRTVFTQRGKVIKKHPVTQGVGPEFHLKFIGHVPLFPVNESMVLAENMHEVFTSSPERFFHGTQLRWDPLHGGNALLVAGNHGKGRVVLYGGLLGLDGREIPHDIKDGELQLLLNSVRWLSGQGEFGIDTTPNVPNRYSLREQLKPAPWDAGGVKIISQPRNGEVAEEGNQEQWVKLGFQAAGKPVTATFECPEGLPTPGAIRIGTDTYPLDVVKSGDKRVATFMITPSARELVGKLLFSASPIITVRMLPNQSAAEITTPESRLTVAAENGKATLQFLEIKDWQYHHTWKGLERATWSAPILRLSPSYWPYADMFPKVAHEIGYPRPDFTAIGCDVSEFGNEVTLKVGDGQIQVFANGQILLNNFAPDGRIATWTVDQYKTANNAFPENVANDMPEISGKMVAEKKGRYALGGNFKLGRIGETGMSPGVMREAKLQANWLFATTRVDTAEALSQTPVKERIRFSLIETPSAAKLDLPLHQVKFKRLIIRRDTGDLLPVKPSALEVFGEWLTPEESARIVRWEADGMRFHRNVTEPAQAVIDDAQMAATMREDDPQKEDENIRARFYLSPMKFVPGDAMAQIRGVDADGRTVVNIPVATQTRFTTPNGIFTYGPQWKVREAECPPSQWPKLMRDVAMSDMDYAIECLEAPAQKDEPENFRQIARRFIRYGMFLCPSILGAPGEIAEAMQVQGLKQVAPLKVKPELEEKYRTQLREFRSMPVTLAWVLADEQAQGNPTDAEHLSVGYQACNYLYDLAKQELGDKVPLVNLFSVCFTEPANARKYLKSDITSVDHYGIWVGVRDAMPIISGPFLHDKDKPKDKPFWLTVKSCGPTFYDYIHLYFDIRRQAVNSWNQGVDSVNYFMYSHWLNNMETDGFYTVMPGEAGPVAAPRRQILDYANADLQMLSTAEYAVLHGPLKNNAAARELLRKAIDAAWGGNFQALRQHTQQILNMAWPK